jgi:hypothetical protein
MSIFTWIGKAAKSVGTWLSKAFQDIETDAAPVAVAIIEELKTLWGGAVPGFIASILDTLLKSQLPSEIVTAIGKALPTLLADALALEGLATNPTPAQITTFEQAVLAAFKVSPDQSQLYSTLGAQIIAIIRANTAPGQKFTFAVLVNDLEQAYQDYLSDQTAAAQ